MAYQFGIAQHNDFDMQISADQTVTRITNERLAKDRFLFLENSNRGRLNTTPDVPIGQKII